MNRLEYLTQLRRSLEDGGLAEDEINDAMGFYEEIFLDAGAAHEAETAANLGSPEELANKILQDSGIHPQGDSVFQMEAAADPSQARDTDNNVPQNGNSLSKLLVIIITSPIWFSLMCAFAAIALAILFHKLCTAVFHDNAIFHNMSGINCKSLQYPCAVCYNKQ